MRQKEFFKIKGRKNKGSSNQIIKNEKRNMNRIMSCRAGSTFGGGKNIIKKQGFTLIEILVVIGIIAVLALIVLVAINPARQFAQARNTQRTSNVEAILNAVGQRMVDNKGIFNGATGCTVAIPTTTPAAAIVVGGGTGFDLACLTPTYMSSIPFDPTSGTASSTGYTIIADANGRVTICAPGGAETAISGSAEICITR